MKKIITTTLTILLFSFLSITYAQLSGTVNVGSGQTYTSLTGSGGTGLFNVINTGGLSGNLTVNITSDITESGNVDLNQWTGTYTVTIQPNDATEKVISGSIANSLFRLNGADRLTIDGRYSGSGKYLRFRNTNGSYPTFTFINDARRNTLTYLYIESNNSNTSSTTAIGTILFSTTTGANGNDSNTISYCDIRDRSDATGYPGYAIYSYGTTTTTARGNSDNTISNNNIYNFWKNASSSGGVYITTGSRNNWVITDNSFYQTATRTFTTAGGWNVIFANYTGINNVSISNNFIGGSSSGCSGSAWTSTGTVAIQLICIRAYVGSTTASNIQGNTIANFNLTNQSNTSSFYSFIGIYNEIGLTHIGTTSGNTIGSTSGTGNITITLAGTSSLAQSISLIERRGNGSISNNQMGSVSVGGTITGTVNFNAIFATGTPTSAFSISGNTIGSVSSSNSIQTTSASLLTVMNLIQTNVAAQTVTISSNVISNVNCLSTSSLARLRGFYHSGNARLTANSNTISNLTGASTSTSTSPTSASLIGFVTVSTDTIQTVSGNTINNLTLNSTANSFVIGFAHTNRSSMGSFTKNNIYDLKNTSTSSSPKIYGVNVYWGKWTYSNNTISITNGEATDHQPNIERNVYDQNETVITHLPENINAAQTTSLEVTNSGYNENSIEIVGVNVKDSRETETDASTNGVYIEGIHEEAEIYTYYYYNTVYIGGTAASGSNNSYAWCRPLTSWPTPVALKNNLFVNARTGSTGKHYAIGNTIAPPTLNWTASSSNYNIFISANASTIGEWSVGVDQTIAQWRTSSGGDKQTWSTTTSVVNPSNLFTDISTGDLTINSSNSEAWLVYGKGIYISSVNTDINGTSRSTSLSGGVTEIGADEFSSVPPSNPNATVDNAPGSGITSTYSLYGRTILVINWGTGGTSYPAAMNVQYYSGVNPPDVLGGNYSNSYWDINPLGTLTGTTYDITFSFGDNETYTIATPGSNTRIAKYLSSWEVFSTAGTGAWQTELDWANLNVKTRAMNTFSSYALTDVGSPLPVEIIFFDGNTVNRDVKLQWATAWEMNNRGFEIQRTTTVNENWQVVGFVNGNGTTYNRNDYSYTDSKLASNKYKYRLRQVDYNGNSETFNLNKVIEIGKPNVFELSQNYPNPSNPKTKIDYSVPFDGKVELKVYDITGREVASIVSKTLEAGFYTSEFDGSNLASGVYFYRIFSDGDGQKFTKTMKLILVK